MQLNHSAISKFRIVLPLHAKQLFPQVLDRYSLIYKRDFSFYKGLRTS
ncbi:hypothetical protein HMPREF9439_00122 [Parasutterella excrementihominis YIT 11859]|uniref:Uncharacterized protein n=1 Tax=Parasutterella excrementihominis YIT 11859 TaxID=762966 RepID=F3QGT4_9BURK|nr:hypothetical protein HMPREF9439_00122 [Parasutterella excrementihominis YIT 11859]